MKSYLKLKIWLVHLTCCIYILYNVKATAQERSSDIDSFQNALKSSLHDTVRVTTLLHLSNAWLLIDLEKADSCNNVALEIAKKINFGRGMYKATNNLGNILSKRGNYPEALESYLAALKGFEELNDLKAAAVSTSNVGIIYYNTGKIKEALTYFEKSLELASKLNEINETIRPMSNAASCALLLGDLKKAQDYYARSLKIAEKMGNQEGMINGTANLGEVASNEGHYEEALAYHLKALEYLKKFNLTYSESQITEAISRDYMNLGDKKKAYAYGMNCLKAAQSYGDKSEVSYAYAWLSEMYEQTGDYKNAYTNFINHSKLKDSLISIENGKQIAEMNTKYETEKKDKEIVILNKDKQLQTAEIDKQKTVRNSLMGGTAVLILFSLVVYRQRNRIAKEKDRSENLLLNILPAEVAAELKAKGKAEARDIDRVTVLFTDFKEFTQVSEKLTAKELVEEINHCFKSFDGIIEKHGIEKIKTIGDAYMAAGGLHATINDAVVSTAKAALEMSNFMLKRKTEREAAGKLAFEMRVGVHTGPVVAGIVGVKKFQYDIWGDTVNIASRMESSGEAGRVNVSETTFELVKDIFNCEYRGEIEAKGKGKVKMYFIRETPA